jgi:hypothetical protein
MASSTDELSPERDSPDILTPDPSSKFTKFEDFLNSWYGAISSFSRYVDLISDFAGAEFFLLDGEALMQYVFNDRMLDLAGSKGGMGSPIPFKPAAFVNHNQDSRWCTSSTLWNDSFLICFADAVPFQSSFSMVQPPS